MIEIVDYQDSWTNEFRDLAFILRQGLGKLALRIDHIGSTSVPGLAAKDVIDIQISAAAFSPELLTAMSILGYSQLKGSEAIIDQPMPQDQTSNGKSGFSIHQKVNAALIPTFGLKDERISGMPSSSVTIYARIQPRLNPMQN